MKISTLAVLAGALLASTSGTFALTPKEQVDQFYEEKYGIVSRRLKLGGDTLRSRRRLEEKGGAGGAFSQLLGAVNGVVGTVKGVTSAIQGVVNLFGTQSSEAIVSSLTNRGFSDLDSEVDALIVSMHTSVFDAYVEDQLALMKIPEKHNKQVNNLLKKATKVYKQEWINLESTFDEESGGICRNFQLMTYRDHTCETMHMVLIEPKMTYKLKEDLFIISKSKSSMGGAFSETKLDFKKGKIPKSLDIPTLQFISEYFQTLALGKLAASRNLIKTESFNEACLGDTWKPPPKQIDPFDMMEEDDDEDAEDGSWDEMDEENDIWSSYRADNNRIYQGDEEESW